MVQELAIIGVLLQHDVVVVVVAVTFNLLILVILAIAVVIANVIVIMLVDIFSFECGGVVLLHSVYLFVSR
jgi:hypothetical protein